MPLSADFVTHVAELIADLGQVEIKRMFGGAAVSRKGIGFAILDDDTMFIKADSVFSAELKRRGSRPWTHSLRKDGSVRELAYWSMPDTAADDPEEAVDLVRRSYAISTHAAENKSARKPPARAGRARKPPSRTAATRRKK